MTNGKAFENCSLKSVMSVWRKEECGRFGPAPFGEWLGFDYELGGRPKDVADGVLFEELSGMDAGKCESCYLCNGIDNKSETCLCGSRKGKARKRKLKFRVCDFCDDWKPDWSLVKKDACKNPEHVRGKQKNCT